MVVLGIYQQLVVVTTSYQQLPVVTGSYQQSLVVISSYWYLLVVTGSYQQLLVVSSSCRQLLVVGGISYWYLLVVAGSYQQLPVITDWSRLFLFAWTISIDVVEVEVQKYIRALNVRPRAEKQLYFSSSHDVSLVDFVSGSIGTLGVLNSPPLGSANVVLNQCSHKAITLRRLYL